MPEAHPFISYVIPVYNEFESIGKLHEEITFVSEKEGYSYEIIIVDDGSTDGTGEVIKKLVPVVYLKLRRNFGQTAALDCGIKHACGDLIITMDGDGQNDPADVPKLINHMESYDLDVVSGWRKWRKDSFMKKIASRTANFVRGFIIKDNLHDSGCSMKVYRRDCFNGISLFGEMHRFIPAVLKIKGFHVGELEVNHRPRIAGQTKYGWKRGVKGIIDMVSVWFWHKYAVRPLHLLGGMGVLCFMAGTAVALVGIGFYIADIALFRFFLPILSAFLLMSGIQLFLFGLIADMMSKSYFETTSDVPYNVREIFRQEKPEEIVSQL